MALDDPRVKDKTEIARRHPTEENRAALDTVLQEVTLEKQASMAAEFDAVHSVDRAKEVGSLTDILAPDDLRPRLYQVYKRMTEAYRVLSDPRLRVAYDACRAQGEHRLTPELRNRRATEDERALKNPLARLYLASGRAKLAAGDALGAQIDAELALSLEASPLLEDLHTQAVRSMVRPESRS